MEVKNRSLIFDIFSFVSSVQKDLHNQKVRAFLCKKCKNIRPKSGFDF